MSSNGCRLACKRVSLRVDVPSALEGAGVHEHVRAFSWDMNRSRLSELNHFTVPVAHEQVPPFLAVAGISSCSSVSSGTPGRNALPLN